MEIAERAATHAALGDVRRLLIVDHLALGDRTVAELGELSDLRGNLLAHHLDVLETSGLIERRVSEGDHRRRYVSLRWDRVPTGPGDAPGQPLDGVAFVCTHNSARSQFAAAIWEHVTGHPARSAGRTPAAAVHPLAVRVADEFGVDLSSSRPAGYDRLTPVPELVVSVCDRAREAELPEAAHHLHWSVPDPVPSGTLKAFRGAFGEIASRVEHLAGQQGRRA